MHRWTPWRWIRLGATAGVKQAISLFAGGLGIGLGLGLALWAHAALADSPLQLCAKGNGQVFYTSSSSCPADAPTALSAVARQTDLAALESTVSTLQSKLTTDEATISGFKALLAGVSLSSDGSTLSIAGNSTLKTVLFSGVNVQVVNGSGSETTLNGLGNLIVGYNDNPFGWARTGSHNLIAGDDNNWTSYGGFVAGQYDFITGPFASVSAGQANTASGEFASVSGGAYNHASEFDASVSGGLGNTASGPDTSVSGGTGNTASGDWSSILGGYQESIASTIHCGYFPGAATTRQC